MTELEMGVRDTLSRLEKENQRMKESENFDSYKYGYSLALELAIAFLKSDLNAWGEKK